jgi:hypothetical protein
MDNIFLGKSTAPYHIATANNKELLHKAMACKIDVHLIQQSPVLQNWKELKHHKKKYKIRCTTR